jgi:hypothetical protein
VLVPEPELASAFAKVGSFAAGCITGRKLVTVTDPGRSAGAADLTIIDAFQSDT